MMSRIQLTDTVPEAITKMVDGNPGALNVLMRCLKDGGQIDPDSAMGGMGVILSLDTLGIYGSRIWMFYKDVCGEDLSTMLAMTRAHQLGLVSEVLLNRAIDNYGEGLDIRALGAAVKEYLPNFQIEVNDGDDVDEN